jgi:hypothetical protein
MKTKNMTALCLRKSIGRENRKNMYHPRCSMQGKLILMFSCAAIALCVSAPRLVGQNQGEAQTNVGRLKAYSWVKPAPLRSDVETTKNLAATHPSETLPLWTFTVQSSRDNNNYTGVMVGPNPNIRGRGHGSASVPTFVVPLIITTHEIGTTVDFNTGNITTVPGDTTFDPTVADTACLASPNDVPLTLVQQSPILQSATFHFGGTNVGRTQYIDAFQRANFWAVDDHNTYHVLLGPVRTLAPVVIDVPSANGLGLATTSFGQPPFCAPIGIVDINWFDAYIDQVVIPELAAQGVNPSTLPIFLVHNLVWAFPPLDDFFNCCVFGYHGTTGLPIQTYAPVNFDSIGLPPPAFEDTGIMAHEIGEWMNDPFDDNPTPLWGHIGQVSGCQNNLEVGDPLTGTEVPPVVMPNGFTYHLQELAFFSWFYGAPSIGVNGWFSNNGTFLTDAGPPCQ